MVKVPDGITSEVAASIMTKGLTTYYLLYKTFRVKSNDTLLFHAAAGGVGQIFCQWAKSIGCKVIGTVGSEEKIKIAKKNGCALVINYSKENFAEKVKEFTKGEGVPVVPHPNDKKWSGISLQWMAWGYGVSLTPLQTLTFYNAIANNGLIYLTQSNAGAGGNLTITYTSSLDQFGTGSDLYTTYLQK